MQQGKCYWLLTPHQCGPRRMACIPGAPIVFVSIRKLSGVQKAIVSREKLMLRPVGKQCPTR